MGLFNKTAELQIQRGVTSAFISMDPVTIALTPRMQQLVNGVRKQADAPQRLPQVMKLVMQSPAGGSIEQHTSSGTARLEEFQLIGEYNCEADIGDWWEDADGTHWEIVAVIPDNGYERRFAVEANGRKPTGG